MRTPHLTIGALCALATGAAFGLLGCDEGVRGADTASLRAEPAMLAFAAPLPGQNTRTRMVSLINEGTGTLRIASVDVSEDDDSPGRRVEGEIYISQQGCAKVRLEDVSFNGCSCIDSVVDCDPLP